MMAYNQALEFLPSRRAQLLQKYPPIRQCPRKVTLLFFSFRNLFLLPIAGFLNQTQEIGSEIAQKARQIFSEHYNEHILRKTR